VGVASHWKDYDAPSTDLVAANNLNNGHLLDVTRGDQFDDVLFFQPSDGRSAKGPTPIWVAGDSSEANSHDVRGRDA
jgi:hypothetical protein